MSTLREAVRHVAGQAAFQRDQHQGWRRAAMGLLVCNLLTVAAFGAYIYLHSTVYITVAATPDGRVVPMTPLDEPIMSPDQLSQWTVSAVTAAFTMGHHDWRRRLAEVRSSFTDEGYESFLAGLDEGLFLERLRKNLQVASAVAQGAAVITQAGLYGGRAGWWVEFPVLVTFQVSGTRYDKKMLVEVFVKRVSREERPAGIGIQQIIATDWAG